MKAYFHWKSRRINIPRLILVVFLFTMAATIASLTIGRDIFSEKEVSIVSFAIVNFSGYLFFLFLPVELAFIYYLHAGYDTWILNLVALSTAILSQSIDYWIGYFFSAGIINRLIGRKRYEKAEDEIRHYGKLTIFAFNLLPLSSPIISLAAGMLKYRLSYFLLFSALGLLVKYILLTLIF